jgi:two-component sensor histidine kinase
VWLAEQSAQDARSVVHTINVQEKLSNLLLNVRRAESGQRGFLLTGRQQYLMDYYDAAPVVETYLAELRTPMSDNPDRAPVLDQMDATARAKMTELAKTVELQASGQHEAAVALVQSDDGFKSMNALRLLVERTLADEERLLLARSDASQRYDARLLAVMAVAQVHRRLYTSEDVKTVATDQCLNALIEDLRSSTEDLRSSTEDDAFAQLSLAADPVETDPDRAVAIGVIVNELVINALKYAYPSGKGPIRVGLRARAEGGNAVISVEDDGVGFADSAPIGSTGLGQRIVKAMADKLGARISHDSLHRGTRIEIAFAP